MSTFSDWLRIVMLGSALSVSVCDTLKAEPKCFEQLTFAVRSPARSVLVGEPIVLHFRLANETGSSCAAPGSLRFEENLISLFVVKDGENEEREVRPFTGGMYDHEVGRMSLSKGQAIESTQAFYGEVSGFPQGPGQYSISAVLRNVDERPQTVRAKLFKITVADPSDPLDIQAYEYVREAGGWFKCFYAFKFHDNDPDGESRLKEFVHSFGDSHYGPWARLFLGRRKCAQRDYVGAAEQFAVVASSSDFPMADEGVAYLAAAKAEGGMVAEAEQLLAALKARGVVNMPEAVGAEDAVARARSRGDR